MKDLIERQAAIDTLDKHLRTTDVPVSYPGIILALTEWLNELPSAQADSKETSSTHKALDTISRQAAIDATWEEPSYTDPLNVLTEVRDRIKALPPAQPDIIYCKDCVKHNKGLGNYEVHPDGSSTWIWKDSACPLVSWRDKAQGHEFDYQFCAYAEKREVTT